MDITLVEEKDIKEILPIILREFAYTKMNEKKVLRRIHGKNFRIFKAVEAGKIIGFIELEKLDFDSVRINGLSIVPEKRRNGFGKQLIDFAVEFLKKKNIRRIFLLVRQSNTEAKKLYSEAGFKIVGTEPEKFEGETVEDLELNLHSEEEETPSYIG
ncbi:MAG: GNAT family N-acetyltransferase [Candidatus ainarchaeum sp.]|nr:GNAT family N-acetyltransferase [Candidatus ainarchaeum sp.]